MKYTHNIYQWCMYNCCCTEIFLDMDPSALSQHSTYFRWLLSFSNTPWHYRNPARRFKDLHLHPFGHWMHENALRYVFCAINQAKNSKRMFLEIPQSFVLTVQVYQVVVFLQVEECIGALHEHIRQVIRDRPLESEELEAVWYCLSGLGPKIYEFALNVQYERERQVWLLGPEIPNPGKEDEVRVVEEGSSGEETVIGLDSDQDIKTITDDMDTSADHIESYEIASEVGYTAEDEASHHEVVSSDHEDQRLTTFFPRRRRSLPTPHSKIMYDIDTSDFRECADEEPQY